MRLAVPQFMVHTIFFAEYYIWANYNNSLYNLNSAAIKGDDSPNPNHDFQGSVAVRSL